MENSLFLFEDDGVEGGYRHEIDDFTLGGVAVSEIDRFLQTHLNRAYDTAHSH